MIVRVHQEEGFSEPMVLKIFDRRFATQLREDSKAKPWTLESEEHYHRLIENGGVAELVPTLAPSIHIEGMQQRTRHIYTTLCRHSMK